MNFRLHQRPPGKAIRPRRSRKGLTMVELVIASGIIAVLLLASAAAMGENVESAKTSSKFVGGAVFLESVEEDLSSLNPAGLLAMNGQTVYSNDDWAQAPFRVEIVVFNRTPRLLAVELRLVDQQRGDTLTSLHTLRAIA